LRVSLGIPTHPNRIKGLDDTITAARHTRVGVFANTILLLALFAAEATIFCFQVARNIAPYYPPNFDQLSYFLATYDLIHQLRAKGFSALLTELLLPSQATGTTFILQGALLSYIGGANRTALLSINLLHFLALQLVFFHTVRLRTGHSQFAWIGAALLLVLATIFANPGGIYDYRIDFSALCLYGIWTCLVIWSDTFLHGWRSFAAAAAAILLIFSRFFVIIYVGSVYGGLLVAALYTIWRSASSSRRAVAVRRTRNIVVFGTLVGVIGLMRLFVSREAIYDYYVVGHVLGDEKYIRAHELGLYSVWDHLLFYPESIVGIHVGLLAILMAAAITLLAVVVAWSSPRVSGGQLLGRLCRFRFDFAMLGLATMVPIAVLTINVAKSPVVGGIVVVPVVLAVVLVLAAVWPPDKPRFPIWQWSAPQSILVTGALRAFSGVSPTAIIALIAMAVSVPAFISRGLSSQQVLPRSELERITELAKTIAEYALDNGLTRPTMSSDRIVDFQNIGTPKLFSIEMLHRELNIDPRFGHGPYGIFATSREDALRLFAESDIIVLTDPVTDRSVPYPMNSKIPEYWDEVWRWTVQNRVLLYSTDILKIPFRVFVRPLARIDGLSEGWITKAGVTIEADAGTLARFPYVVLEGPADFYRLGGQPQPRAVMVDATGKASGDLPVTLTRIDSTYRITIDAHAAPTGSVGKARILLTFDRYFVPSRLGINSDVRELVMSAPTKHELRPKRPE